MNIAAPSVMDIPVVTYRDERVLNTTVLAAFFETTENGLWMNYSRNEDRFAEAKHFFRLEGQILTKFRDEMNAAIDRFAGLRPTEDGLRPTNSGSQTPLSGLQMFLVSPKTRSLILWTQRGASLLAKIIDTDPAWSHYEELVDFYYDRREQPATPHGRNEKEFLVLHKAMLDTIKTYNNTKSEGHRELLNAHVVQFCKILGQPVPISLVKSASCIQLSLSGLDMDEGV